MKSLKNANIVYLLFTMVLFSLPNNDGWKVGLLANGTQITTQSHYFMSLKKSPIQHI